MRETTRPPILLPLLAIAAGVALLLINFLILENVNFSDLLKYWPVLLISVGVLIAVRGDLAFTAQGQTFGITRGNVESAQLEASAGELDVHIRALRREGRLIAGQFTARSRPLLGVRGTHARLTMQRGQTWLLSMADWEIGLAKDLPWSLLLSSFLGEIDADLRGVTLERAHFGTSFGDVLLVAPEMCAQGIQARSSFGNIMLTVPEGVQAVIRVNMGPLARLRVNEARFLLLEEGVYATLGAGNVDAPVRVSLGTTFGTVRLN